MEQPKVNVNTSVSRYHLIIFQHPDDEIDRGMVRSIQDELDNRITTPPNETEIDIWIESVGGDAHSAYKLFLDLRSRCRRLQSVVIDYAKSAATLLVMGTDRIFMAPAAELGPLDVQLEHPDREGVIISGLEAAGSLEFVTRAAFGLACSGGASLVKYTGLPRAVVLKDTLDFMAQLLQPIVSKFDPHLISQASKQLKVAERYATIMLKGRKLPLDKQMDGEVVQKLLKRLVTAYPVHEFVISRNEAAELGLPVADAYAHPRWMSIKTLYDAPREKGSSLLSLIPDAEIEAVEKASVSQQEMSDEKDSQDTTTGVQHEENGSGTATTGELETFVRSKTL